MALRPTPMSRVVLVGAKEDEDAILSLLHDRQVVQVEPASKETLAHFAPERAGEVQRRLSEELLRFKALVGALPAVPVSQKRHFADIPSLLEAAGAVKIDDEVREAKRKEDAALTARKATEEQLELVRDYGFFPEDLSVLTAQSLLSYFGEAPEERYAEFRAELGELAREAFFLERAEPKRVRFVVSVPRAKAETFGRLAQKHAVRLTAVPDLRGSPAQLRPQLEKELSAIDARIREGQAALRSLSEKWYPTLLAIEEQLNVEARKADVHGRLAGVRSSFALEGFVPTPQVAPLRAELEKLTQGRTMLFDQDAGPGAPTLMRNPKGFSVFEFFIRFFSLPLSDEIDPTLVFAVVFPIFFGLMLSDVGYGGFILAVCLWMIWRIGNPKAGPTIVPKFLVKFTTMVMPAPAMKQLAKALIPGCIIGIILGVCFDAYFGFTLGQLTAGHFDYAVFPGAQGKPAPVFYIAKLLLVSVYIGLAMVTVGFVFGAVNEYFHKNWKHVAGKCSWILVAWGITLFGLSMINHSNYSGSWIITPSPSAADHAIAQYTFIALLVVGALGALATEGVLAAIEIASVVSHVLSYARLVGILLASVILAYVINLIAVVGTPSQPALITHGVGFALMGIVLVVVIAVFNIILGVFEPGIQGARLLYVEYFSKFYKGNGKAFRPFGAGRSFTHPQFPAAGAPAAAPAAGARPPA